MVYTALLGFVKCESFTRKFIFEKREKANIINVYRATAVREFFTNQICILFRKL